MTRHLAVPALLCVGLLVATAGCGSGGARSRAASEGCEPSTTTLGATAEATPSTETDVDAELLSLARGAVVRVETSSGKFELGTAFRTVGGALVTARHVPESNSVRLSTSVGTDLTATVSAVSPENDLASMTGPAGDGLTLASSDPPPATPVWVAGYPFGSPLRLVRGSVLDYTAGGPFGESGRLMRSDVPLKTGNSGSPVLDSSGEVVGLAFGIESDNSDSLIVPISSVRHFLGVSCH